MRKYIVTVNLNTFKEHRGWETTSVESKEYYTKKEAEAIFDLLWEELVKIEEDKDKDEG